MAISKASHITTNGNGSLIDCKLLLRNSHFSDSKASKALPDRGKFLVSAKGHILIAKPLIYFA